MSEVTTPVTGPPLQHLPDDAARWYPTVTAERKDDGRVEVSVIYPVKVGGVVTVAYAERVPASTQKAWVKKVVAASTPEVLGEFEAGDILGFGANLPDMDGSDAYGVWVTESAFYNGITRLYLTKMMPR